VFIHEEDSKVTNAGLDKEQNSMYPSEEFMKEAILGVFDIV